MPFSYAHTLVPDSPWQRLGPTTRSRLVSFVWLVTWGCLLLGYQDAFYWKLAVAISAAQAVAITALVGFRPLVFPAQLRIAYVAWVALAAFVPELVAMMYITTAGLAALLAFGYCPLARMLYLLPWNRSHALTWRDAPRVFLQPPRPGRFCLTNASSMAGATATTTASG